MTEDERTDEESASPADGEDVEAHGAKKIVGTGLAAAALLGAGAAGVVKLTGDDDRRTAGALTTREDAVSSLARADRDGDGYLSYRELAYEGMKWNVAELGKEVTAEGLAAAGYKLRPELLGEGGFALERDTIMLKADIDKELDSMVERSALDWSSKLREIDRDGDGYAGSEELAEAGFKFNVAELQEAGSKVTPEELAKAGYKVELAALGEGGFMIEGESIMLKLKIDAELDAILDKH